MSEEENVNLIDLEKMIAGESEDELKDELKDTAKTSPNNAAPIKIDAALDKAYNVRASVKNVDDILQTTTIESADFTNNCRHKVDYNLPYGSAERNTLDLFWPNNSAEAPMVMFIHGGYWRALSKNDFSHMAKGLLDHSYCVAIPSYRLCSDVSLQDIIDDLRQACLYLWRRHSKRIQVIGHSAGAHLAACLLATDWPALEPYAPEDLVTKGTLISGLYDLEPLLHTSVNESLRMDSAIAKEASPIHYMVDTDRQVNILVGEKDPAVFIKQSKKLYDIWHLLGVDVTYRKIDGTNHYTIIDPLTDSKSGMVHDIVKLQSKPAHGMTKVPSQSVEERVIEQLRKKKQPHDAGTDGDTANSADIEIEVAQNEPPKPTPVNDIYDDLTRIKGINGNLAHKLFDVGIKSFAQLSLLNDENIPIFERIIERKGFVKKYNIVAQAKKLLKDQDNSKNSQGLVQSFYRRKAPKDSTPVTQDELTRLTGIGPVYQERLYSVGIQSFADLAQVTNDEAKILDRQLDLNERIFIDDWTGQAQAILDAEKAT